MKGRVASVAIAMLIVVLAVFIAGCGLNRVQKAKELMDADAFVEAYKLISEEISDNPKNVDAYLLAGRIQMKRDIREGEEGAYAKFNSAIKLKPSAKDQVKEVILKEKDPSCDDLTYLNRILPKLHEENKEFCYKYFVGSGSDRYNASEYADHFPEDPKAPEAIMTEAELRFSQNQTFAAKELFQRLVRKYPKSTEAAEAKRRLADWWVKNTFRVLFDTRWHGYSVRKGQRYRYYNYNSREIDHGAWGIERINQDNMRFFNGTLTELEVAKSPSFDYTGPRTQPAKSYGEGMTRGGYLWFVVDTGRELRDSFEVELQFKE